MSLISTLSAGESLRIPLASISNLNFGNIVRSCGNIFNIGFTKDLIGFFYFFFIFVVFDHDTGLTISINGEDLWYLVIMIVFLSKDDRIVFFMRFLSITICKLCECSKFWWSYPRNQRSSFYNLEKKLQWGHFNCVPLKSL